MQLTKHAHACVSLAKDGARIECRLTRTERARTARA
jgi:hypothetical protein